MRSLKWICLVVISLLIGVTFTYADQHKEVPKQFGSIQELQEYFGNTMVIYDLALYRGAYLIGPYDKNSTDGFYDTIQKDGRTWKFRIRYAQIAETNVGNVTGVKFLVNVAAGQEKYTEYSYTYTETTTATASFGLAIGKKINLGVTYSESGAVSETWKKGVKYTFPPICISGGYNSASFYAGMTHDLITVVVDLVPWERPSGFQNCIDECAKSSMAVFNDNFMENGDLREDSSVRRPPDDEYYWCVEGCKKVYPFILKMDEMQSTEGTFLLPRPITWSVCEKVY